MSILIYARHPIMYQVPIFKELYKLNKNSLVLFGSDLSLKKRYFKEISSTFSPDTPNLLNGYEYKILRNFGTEKYSFFSRVNPTILKYLINENFKFILVHGYDNITTFLLILISKFFGKKIIWRGEVIGNREGLKKIILKFILNFVDIKLYSCEGNKKFIESLGYKLTNKNFIRCAVDNKYFKQQRMKTGFWNGDKFTIIFSGRFIDRKRPFDIVNALKLIPHDDIKIIWIGNGPLFDYIKKISKQLSCESIFTGFLNQSQLSKFYAMGKIGIVSSDYDPSPKVVNELLNFNVISLMSNGTGTCQDLSFDNKDIFPTGNIKLLSERILYYKNNFEKKKRRYFKLL